MRAHCFLRLVLHLCSPDEEWIEIDSISFVYEYFAMKETRRIVEKYCTKNRLCFVLTMSTFSFVFLFLFFCRDPVGVSVILWMWHETKAINYPYPIRCKVFHSQDFSASTLCTLNRSDTPTDRLMFIPIFSKIVDKTLGRQISGSNEDQLADAVSDIDIFATIQISHERVSPVKIRIQRCYCARCIRCRPQSDRCPGTTKVCAKST